MADEEFLESGEGMVMDAAIDDLAAWYSDRQPETDKLDFSAQLLLMRVYGMITAASDKHGNRRLNSVRYNLLRLLYQADDRRLLMTQIGHRLAVSPTNITKLVDDLVAEDLVQRVTDPQDKRKRWAVLTDQGAQVFESELPLVAGLVQHLWSVLTPEEKQLLVHLLSKFRKVTLERQDTSLD